MKQIDYANYTNCLLIIIIYSYKQLYTCSLFLFGRYSFGFCVGIKRLGGQGLAGSDLSFDKFVGLCKANQPLPCHTCISKSSKLGKLFAHSTHVLAQMCIVCLLYHQFL